ncbi:MarR family winged helix-turn-helix transcriptional regulator, partial [Pseudonocardia nigra]|uniref:MarR family winged helix-turn-helix transcriptional regulator n=1 Tax=Pseudonocardia nigra TaxID=1921578 RepID=UPI001FE8344A
PSGPIPDPDASPRRAHKQAEKQQKNKKKDQERDWGLTSPAPSGMTLDRAKHRCIMQLVSPDPLVVAASLDQLVTLLPRLSPRRGLSLVAASTLATLERGGPLRLTELAEAQAVTQPAMTGLVGRLAAQGLVERSPDPHDRRSVLVAVTDAGRALLARRSHDRAEALAALIAELDADDRAAIAAAAPAITRLVSGGTPA